MLSHKGRYVNKVKLSEVFFDTQRVMTIDSEAGSGLASNRDDA